MEIYLIMLQLFWIESYSAVCRQRLFTLYEKIKKYCLL